LSWALPASARRLTTLLLEYAGKYGLPFWQSWARFHERALLSVEEVGRECSFLPPEIKDSALTAIQLDVIATLREDRVPAEALARRQNALSWELRTATSLARLWRDLRRLGEARELLSAVRDRFREGSQTRDYLKANALLRELSALPDVEPR
jgi:hypothetical protein